MITDLGVLVFIWVFGCLGAALIAKFKYNSTQPYWKIFLLYVSLPMSAIVGIGVWLAKRIF